MNNIDPLKVIEFKEHIKHLIQLGLWDIDNSSKELSDVSEGFGFNYTDLSTNTRISIRRLIYKTYYK